MGATGPNCAPAVGRPYSREIPNRVTDRSRVRLEEAMLSNILVPFDGSELAERAFPYATALARAGGARLILLHARTAAGGGIRTVAELAPAADRLRDSGVT